MCRWGIEITAEDLKDPRLRPPRCYDGVRTCRFCAQFFDNDDYKKLPASPSKTARPDAPSKSPIHFE